MERIRKMRDLKIISLGTITGFSLEKTGLGKVVSGKREVFIWKGEWSKLAGITEDRDKITFCNISQVINYQNSKTNNQSIRRSYSSSGTS